MKIPLSKPFLGSEEEQLVLKVLRSGQLTRGPILRKFEEEFAEYVGVKHAIGVSSGTAGLHLALLSLKIRSGDEVITSPFSFISTSNTILYVGAQPVFVDIEPINYNIDVANVERKITEKTKAILPAHIFGVPCDLEPLLEICEKYNLFLVEDACEALGAMYNGRRVGSFGDVSVFSFYPNKNITTGEGGMVCTNSDQLARLVRALRNQGRLEGSHWLSHELIGYNYRLSDIHSAVGLTQLRKIERINEKRKRIALRYNDLFAKLAPEVKTPFDSDERVWFVYVIELHEMVRDKVASKLNKKGVECKPYFPPIHLQLPYRELGFKEGMFPVCESVSKRILALPFYTAMEDWETQTVVKCVRETLIK